jgi:hypothetical protein
MQVRRARELLECRRIAGARPVIHFLFLSCVGLPRRISALSIGLLDRTHAGVMSGSRQLLGIRRFLLAKIVAAAAGRHATSACPECGPRG